MRGVALLGAISVVLVGCANLDFFVPVHNYQPELRVLTETPALQDREARVGDDLVRQGRSLVRETIYIPEQLAVSQYTITPGYFRKVGQSEKGEFFFPAGSADGGTILQRGISDPPQALFVFAKTGVLCVVAITNLIGCERPLSNVTFASAAGYERRRKTEVGDGSFLQSLSFNGMSGDRIRLLYSEVSPGMPPLRSEVEHDLATSRQIEYRGARIEVLEATNRMIRYRVLQQLRAPG